MTVRFCKHCGAATAEGKAFCSRCGNRLTQPAPSAHTTMPNTPPSLMQKSCSQCGEPVIGGKSFCRRCGKAIESMAPLLQPPVAGSSACQDSKASAHEAILNPVEEISLAPAPLDTTAEVGAATAPLEGAVPEMGLVVDTSGIARPAPVGPDVPARKEPVLDDHGVVGNFVNAPSLMEDARSPARFPPASSHAKVDLRSQLKQLRIPMALAVAALVLVAGGASIWHFRRQLGLSRVTRPRVAAFTPAVTVPSPTPAAPTSATATPQTSPVPIRLPSAAQNLPSAPPYNPAAPTGSVSRVQTEPKMRSPIAKPPDDGPQTAPPAPSGILHYTGPPIPYGGTVVFSALPAGRLRFTFDHQAWQPLISRQPDGTQTLTLRSMKRAQQSQCDVQWEIAP